MAQRVQFSSVTLVQNQNYAEVVKVHTLCILITLLLIAMCSLYFLQLPES